MPRLVPTENKTHDGILLLAQSMGTSGYHKLPTIWLGYMLIIEDAEIEVSRIFIGKHSQMWLAVSQLDIFTLAFWCGCFMKEVVGLSPLPGPLSFLEVCVCVGFSRTHLSNPMHLQAAL